MYSRKAISAGVIAFLSIGSVVAWKTGIGIKPGAEENNNVSGSEIVYLGSEGVVFQRGGNDCGLAALAMVFGRYGIEGSPQMFEHEIRPGTRGISMMKLKELGEARGLLVHGWKLGVKDLSGMKFPIILFMNEHHYIVADSIDARGFIFVRDPAVGRLRFPPGRMTERWKGEALVFESESPRMQ
jgi:ABC-type bacteriocin/lantibiotic exporter with double-glycine peptidase domain